VKPCGTPSTASSSRCTSATTIASRTAKTQLLGGDLVACVMGGVYTEVEMTMIELQRSPVVRDVRSSFQVAMQHRFIEVVERLSGREVLMFTSNSHVGPDVEIELFLLSPER